MTVNQVSGTTTGQTPANGQQVSSDSNVHIIDGGDVPPPASDDLQESILSGNVFSIGGTSANHSP